MRTQEVTMSVLAKLDPMRLIFVGAPPDEYKSEAILILLGADEELEGHCRHVFEDSFDNVPGVNEIDFKAMAAQLKAAWAK